MHVNYLDVIAPLSKQHYCVLSLIRSKLPVLLATFATRYHQSEVDSQRHSRSIEFKHLGRRPNSYSKQKNCDICNEGRHLRTDCTSDEKYNEVIICWCRAWPKSNCILKVKLDSLISACSSPEQIICSKLVQH